MFIFLQNSIGLNQSGQTSAHNDHPLSLLVVIDAIIDENAPVIQHCNIVFQKFS